MPSSRKAAQRLKNAGPLSVAGPRSLWLLCLRVPNPLRAFMGASSRTRAGTEVQFLSGVVLGLVRRGHECSASGDSSYDCG